MALPSFNIQIDKVDRKSWDQILSQFDDASLYQTWSYGAVRRGSGNVSHIVLKTGDEILGCCQMDFRRLPFMNIAIADAKWGPLWKKKAIQTEPDVLLRLIRALKNEYAVQRRCLVRLWPQATAEQKEIVKSILESQDFKCIGSIEPYRTLRLDISPSLDELRQNLVSRWRTSLNKAERNGLRVVEGTTDEFFGIFIRLAKECQKIKKFNAMDYEVYRRIQNDLPESLKMKFCVCEAEGEPVCASAYAAIGETGVYTLGATGEKGYGLNAAYLLQWHMIKRLKESGIRWYDLGGIDPDNNPGVYRFKLGVVGKSGNDEKFLGEFHGCFTTQAKIAKMILDGAKILRDKVRKLK